MKKAPYIVVAWGGGRNSTAMLVGMKERNIQPNLILFADTGGEKPETYEFRDEFKRWLMCAGFPPLYTLYKGGKDITLEEDCLAKKHMPSIVNGRKSCSHKFKREPQDTFCNNVTAIRNVWADGDKVLKYIGFDAGEERRAHIRDDEKYIYEYPLIEWGWGLEECEAAIRRARLPMPPKSACFFCPSSKKREVIALAETHPDLFKRAIQMESRAIRGGYYHSIDGLGRHWAWGDLVKLYREGKIDKQGKPIKSGTSLPVLTEPNDAPCGCFDGED